MRDRLPYLKLGHLYEVPGHGVCRCERVNFSRAWLQPIATHLVVVPGNELLGRPERRFYARGDAFDVSPTSPLREVLP